MHAYFWVEISNNQVNPILIEYLLLIVIQYSGASFNFKLYLHVGVHLSDYIPKVLQAF